MHVSVVIPTYNERGTIKFLIKRIFALNIPNLEIIIVDDSSPDGTLELVRALRKRFPVSLILRPKKLGLGSALRDGLSLAREHGADIVITMDADLSHDPILIKDMLQKIQNGAADLIVGSRRIPDGKIQGWSVWRAFMSRGAMEFSRRLLDIKTRDVTSGFRAYRRRILETVDLNKLRSTGYAFQEEMLFRLEKSGFKILELPIIFNDRRRGKSKLGLRDIAEFFYTVIRLRLSSNSPP
ncbi:MAG: Glycosyl transferase family 2 [Parcubacteria group bacterium GW2011_GWC2_45_7]|nr:MAG: Glycosyl transferase family 2 [Parcubacteria group bacterium GW2011_GWC2_45_7]